MTTYARDEDGYNILLDNDIGPGTAYVLGKPINLKDVLKKEPHDETDNNLTSDINAGYHNTGTPLYRKNEKPEAVNHPQHYGRGRYEVIKVINAWGLNFDRGNAVKYIARAGKKNPAAEIEDLEKAIFYLKYEVKELKKRAEE